MDNFKPTKYFIENKLTTLSERQLRRKCVIAFENNESYVIKVKNNNGVDKWLIDELSIKIIGLRKRKSKKKKRDENYFNVEVSINFKDTSDYAYYSEIARIFHEKTGYDLVYKIENEKEINNSNHLHMGIHGNKDVVKQNVDYIVTNVLQRECNKFHSKSACEHKSSIHVKNIIDEKSFINYISKGYDRLGGDNPNYLIR